MNSVALKTIAILFAGWFALTGIFWVYWASLFIAYPFGIASFLIWRRLKKDSNSALIIPVLLVVGLILSLLFLFIPMLGYKI